MGKAAYVGPKNRRGFRLMVDGVQCHFKAGERIPDSVKIQGKYFKDKRAIWVDETPVKRESPKPTPKTEKKVETIGTPSPSSEGAGVTKLTSAPLEVNEQEAFKKKPSEKKRRRKKLFSKD